MLQVLLMLAMISYAGQLDAQGTTYILRADRTAEQAIRELVHSQHRGEFERELVREHNMTFAELRRTRLIVYPCGDECTLETAYIGEDGRSHYWRNVEGHEPVAGFISNNRFYPLFLPACGNPVRPVALPEAMPEPAIEPLQPTYGCTDGTVQYSTGSWQNPGVPGYWGWGSGGHGYGWTISHHRGMVCNWPSQNITGGDE
jgi:hypothetical protein